MLIVKSSIGAKAKSPHLLLEDYIIALYKNPMSLCQIRNKVISQLNSIQPDMTYLVTNLI